MTNFKKMYLEINYMHFEDKKKTSHKHFLEHETLWWV